MADEANRPGGPVGRGRGRRPADEVRADVLRTAGELLLAEGMAPFTFERVARASGVSKTTLYKWWPSKGALALDGYFHAVEHTLAFPDTGDIRADLLTQLHAFARLMTRTPGGRILTELIGAAQTDADLATAYRQLYSAHRRRLAGERLRRAQELGQIRADIDVQVLVDQLWGAVYHRLLIPDEPVTEDFVTALVDNLLDGARTADAPVPEEAGARRTRIRRADRPGDLGWAVMAHGELYERQFGWNTDFEALVAGIVADYAAGHSPATEAAWIAEVDGRRAGCVFLVAGDRPDVARLRILLVAPQARGLGLGSRLVAETLAFAREAGYRRVTLWTNDVLVSARRIYEHFGFTLTDEEPHHSFGHDLVGQTWSLDLGDRPVTG